MFLVTQKGKGEVNGTHGTEDGSNGFTMSELVSDIGQSRVGSLK